MWTHWNDSATLNWAFEGIVLIAPVSTGNVSSTQGDSRPPWAFCLLYCWNVTFMRLNSCRSSGVHSFQWHGHRENLQGSPSALGHSWTGEVSLLLVRLRDRAVRFKKKTTKNFSARRSISGNLCETKVCRELLRLKYQDTSLNSQSRTQSVSSYTRIKTYIKVLSKVWLTLFIGTWRRVRCIRTIKGARTSTLASDCVGKCGFASVMRPWVCFCFFFLFEMGLDHSNLSTKNSWVTAGWVSGFLLLLYSHELIIKFLQRLCDRFVDLTSVARLWLFACQIFASKALWRHVYTKVRSLLVSHPGALHATEHHTLTG